MLYKCKINISATEHYSRLLKISASYSSTFWTLCFLSPSVAFFIFISIFESVVHTLCCIQEILILLFFWRYSHPLIHPFFSLFLRLLDNVEKTWCHYKYSVSYPVLHRTATSPWHYFFHMPSVDSSMANRLFQTSYFSTTYSLGCLFILTRVFAFYFMNKDSPWSTLSFCK